LVGVTRIAGVDVWFIEGLDLRIPDMNKMNVVAPIVDSLQRIATWSNVAVLASVGAPKQKGKDRYYGRDALFGSAALARKVETVVLMSLNNEEDPNTACGGVGYCHARDVLRSCTLLGGLKVVVRH